MIRIGCRILPGISGFANLAHHAERGVGPRHRRPADRERRLRLEHGDVAGIADGIGGEQVAHEGTLHHHRCVAARNIGRAEPQETHGLDQHTGGARATHSRQPDHRRQQHHAVEPARSSRMGGAQQNRRTHGLGKRKERRRTVRQNDLVDEAVEIDLIFIEIAHIAFAWVAQRTVRHPLPAPVERRDREAARAQVAARSRNTSR